MSMEGRNKLFAPTVARQSDDGTWFLMNKQEGGWSSFAFQYFTLDHIRENWQVNIGGAGEDEFSTFRHVLPIS